MPSLPDTYGQGALALLAQLEAEAPGQVRVCGKRGATFFGLPSPRPTTLSHPPHTARRLDGRPHALPGGCPHPGSRGVRGAAPAARRRGRGRRTRGDRARAGSAGVAGEILGGAVADVYFPCSALSTHFPFFISPQAATAPTPSPAALPLAPALAAARLPPDVLAPLPLAALDDDAVVAAAEWDRVLREAAPPAVPRAVLPPPDRTCGPPDAATAAATTIQLAWRRHAARATVARLRAAPADGRSVAAAARAAARAAAAAALPSLSADAAATDGAAAREAARAAALAWADAYRDDSGALPASLPEEEGASPSPPPPPPPPLHTLRAPPSLEAVAAHDAVSAWTGAWAGGAPTPAEDAAAARAEAAAAAVAAATAAGRAEVAALLRDARAEEAKAGKQAGKPMVQAPAAGKKQASPPPKKQAGAPPPAAPPAVRPLPPLDCPLLTTLADLAAHGIASPPPKRVLWHASPAGLAVEAPRWPPRVAAAAAVAATVCGRLGVAAATPHTPLPGPPSILLHGPHGGGKTTLVRWAAAACRTRVFCVSPTALASAPSDAAAASLVRAVLATAAACGPAIVHVTCVDVAFVRDAGRAAAALAAWGEGVSLPPTRLCAALLSPLAEAAAATAAGAPFIVVGECGAPPAATAHDGEALAAAFAGGVVGVGPLSRADAAAFVAGACAARCIRPPTQPHLSALATSIVGWTAGAVVAAVVAAAAAAPDTTTPLDGSAVAAALATGPLPPAAGDLEAGLTWAAAGGGEEKA